MQLLTSINGSACPIWSRDLLAKLAAGAALMCGRTSASRKTPDDRSQVVFLPHIRD
jgi:hypothetical protein